MHNVYKNVCTFKYLLLKITLSDYFIKHLLSYIKAKLDAQQAELTKSIDANNTLSKEIEGKRVSIYSSIHLHLILHLTNKSLGCWLCFNHIHEI